MSTFRIRLFIWMAPLRHHTDRQRTRFILSVYPLAITTMPITFHPRPGIVLMCDFTTGFMAPEIIKMRPVVVVSPHHIKRHNLYTVVPLSRTEPNPSQPYHVYFPKTPVAGEFGACWAKCDMVMSVSTERLDRKKVGRGAYKVTNITPTELDLILLAIKYSIGIK